MIFQLIFPDKKEYVQAKSQLDLLQNYCKEYDDFYEIEKVIEISEEQAKTIMLVNTEDEHDPDDMEQFSLLDQVTGNDFCILSSTEWF